MEVEGVRQELYLVQVVECDSLSLMELTPGPRPRLDQDGVPVKAGDRHVSLNVDSHVFPRYVGGVNLQQSPATSNIFPSVLPSYCCGEIPTKESFPTFQ